MSHHTVINVDDGRGKKQHTLDVLVFGSSKSEQIYRLAGLFHHSPLIQHSLISDFMQPFTQHETFHTKKVPYLLRQTFRVLAIHNPNLLKQE